MLRDPAADLLLGGSCVGCERPGRVLCDVCRVSLPVLPTARWPDAPPAGLATPFSAASYQGVVRTLVVAHKERGLAGLRPVLGDLLALAVVEAMAHGVATGGPAAPLLLVPVPSRAVSVRTRGHDPTLAITRAAATTLGAAGVDVEVARVLRVRPGVVDQAGLDRAQRHANLEGSMACRPGAQARLARRAPGAARRVVVCDDVVTTGSTAREAQRALAAVGVGVLAIASVAATPLG